MDKGNTALGHDISEAHEAALVEAEQHCHFKKHAKSAVEAYLSRMHQELQSRGFLLSIVKIQDEQDN